MAVELDNLGLRKHFFDPDNTWMATACIFDLLPHLCCNLRGVGSTSAKHYLGLLRQIGNSVDQMRHALLSSDTANEQDIGHGRIHPIVGQCPYLRNLLVFGRIDPIINDMDTMGLDLRIGAENVALHAF